MNITFEPKNAVWIPSLLETSKEFAVVAGQESGKKQYVARAIIAGDAVPTKFQMDTNSVQVGHGRCQIILSKFEILVAPVGSWTWLPCEQGQLPSNAIPAGVDPNGDTYFIGRSFKNGELTIGTVHPKKNGCFVVHSEKEQYYQNYDVLCRKELERVTTTVSTTIVRSSSPMGCCESLIVIAILIVMLIILLLILQASVKRYFKE